MIYRREIDGLRAIAVLSVIFFHAGFTWFRGGYVGVDVFFVISGYLITSLIITEKQTGTFSLASFYERRARRILPALFVVMLACVPFALLLMLPYQLANFAKSVLAVCLFSSNVLFWRESGYFEPATELKPLLHTWSLGIEEQFYLIFPLLLLLVWRFGLRTISGLFVITAVLSLSLAEWALNRSIGVANFYLLPTRAWELLIGCAAAVYLNKNTITRFNGIGAATGLALILVSVFLYDRTTPFPSLYALAPTLGAVLIILFASRDTAVSRLLSLPVFVGVGLISYSAYLWHQPLFAFARLASFEKGSASFLVLIVVTMLLAWASYRLVELPYRNRVRVSRRQIYVGAGATSLLFVLAAIPIIHSQGLIDRYPEKDRALLSLNPAELGRYTERRFNQLAGSRFKSDDRIRVAIIGDSFAQDFVNMASENDYFKSAQVVTYPLAHRCPIYLGSADVAKLYEQNGEKLDERYCLDHSNIAHALELARSANVVILAGAWRKWEAERIEETAHSLVSQNQMLIVVGTKDFGDIKPLSYISLTTTEKAAVRNKLPDTIIETNAILRHAIPEFIDLPQMLCTESCAVFTPSGELISYDGRHLTPVGARYVGELVFKHPALGKLR